MTDTGKITKDVADIVKEATMFAKTAKNADDPHSDILECEHTRKAVKEFIESNDLRGLPSNFQFGVLDSLNEALTIACPTPPSAKPGTKGR